MWRWVLAMMVVAAVPGEGVAQQRPPVAPTKDVQVTYRATGPSQGGQPGRQQEIKVATTAGGGLMRVEGMGGPHGGAYVIVDRASQRMTMVMPQDRRYMEMPANEAFSRGFVLNDSMTFVKKGTETVAGLSCTAWDVTSKDGAGSACITDDGVMLRGRGSDGKGGIEATAVKYGPQAAALFKPPADFTRMEMPAGAGPGAGPGGRPPGR